MGSNPFQHVDLRVGDLQAARLFYAALLPAVGFTKNDTQEDSAERWQVFTADCEAPTWFGFTEDRAHRPNANRIAFRADSRDAVDRLAEIARVAGARNMSGPRPCPEYTATYYAVFFDDPCGNPLEICHL